MIWEKRAFSDSLLGNDFDVDGDTLHITNPHVLSGSANVKISGGDLFVKPGFQEDQVVIAYTVSDGNGGNVESRLTLASIREHNFAPTFSGLYTITNKKGTSVTFAFHAEDKNGGDTWTLKNGEHVMGDIASVSGANLHSDYPLPKLKDHGYGHFTFSHYPTDQENTHTTFTLTVRDRSNATGTIFVDYEKMQLGVGPVYHYSPVALDLDGDGIELVDLSANVIFDWNGDGKAEKTGWLGGDDGFLVYDYNHDQTVTSADELVLKDYADKAETDLEGLAAFDSDEDGSFTANDEKWQDFGIWQDKNSDGVSDEGEYTSLDDAGVSSIHLQSDGDFHEQDGNVVYGTTTYEKTDGTVGEAGDVGLNGEEVELELVDTPDDDESTATTELAGEDDQSSNDDDSTMATLELDDAHVSQMAAQLSSDMALDTGDELSFSETEITTVDMVDALPLHQDDGSDENLFMAV